MFAASKTASVSGGYQISRSLRFNAADSAYLNRTPAGAGNRTTWTWSGWIKFSKITGYQYIFGASSDNYANNFTLLQMDNAASTLAFFDYTSAYNFQLIPTMVFRDPSAWYHIVLTYDSNNATSSNRVKMYVNGSQITAFNTANYPTSARATVLNSATVHNYGTSSYPISGYVTETNFIDGQALTPSSFGETNAQTGVWSPIAYSGSYGTNGFYLNFSDNSNTTAATLGADYSGNGNNWTPNNFSVTAGAGNDSLVDSPTSYGTDTGAGGTVRGNYCTLNPLSNIAGTWSNGNLQFVGPNNNRRSNSTIAVSTGKWYWEVTLGNAPATKSNSSDYNSFGFGLSTVFGSTTSPSVQTDALTLSDNAYYKNFSGASTDSGTTFASGDVLSIAVDLDANTFTFRKNNSSLVTGTIGGTAGRELTPIIISYSGDFGVMYANFGQRAFAYTAPSGFKALNTQNLPTPTIGATTATTADKFFTPVTFTSSATGSVTISSLGFQPDFTWWKSRATVNSDHYLMDVLRGNSTYLASNRTLADQTYSNIWTPSSSGWTSSNGSYYNNDSTVAWNWKANGTGSTNTAGSITSTVSANTTSGFSVVTYTAVGGVSTVGHGLGVVPSMMIFKDRDGTANWPVYHISLGNTSACLLDSTAASSATANWWNNTSPTSSVVTIGSNENTSTRKYVAYCFAPVAGFSAFGSYTGNGSADGPFVYTGFRPAYVLAKKSSGIEIWFVLDSKRGTYNVNKPRLNANNSDAESSAYDIMDFTSNGFKFRNSDTSWNGNGDTYIFAAFAESPFKYSLAR